MFALIYENIHRQLKGMELLEELQKEEFELLTRRDAAAVSTLEFSIHELLRQLAVERDDLKKIMNGTLLREYAEMLPPDDSVKVKDILAGMDKLEQRCARQAELNSALSLALLDTSHELMNCLYEQVQPKQYNVYGAKGSYTAHRPQASLISGRL